LLAVMVGLVAMAPVPRDRGGFCDHICAYNFRVEIEGVDAGQFQSVDGLSIEKEVIEYQNGDDPILRKRPGRTKYSNITLKHGYINGDAMWDCIRNNLSDVSTGKGPDRRDGTIILQGKGDDEVARYNFFEAWPYKWKGVHSGRQRQ